MSWATPCKRGEAEAQLGESRSQSSEPRRVGCGKNYRWEYATLDTHDAPFFAVGEVFFGEADFFSAKRLFLREAWDVSGEHSEPP